MGLGLGFPSTPKPLSFGEGGLGMFVSRAGKGGCFGAVALRTLDARNSASGR